MKLETFFEKFDELADTPDGVKSMRELVLRLAFTGGLTGKRPTDDGVPDGWERRTIESISTSISSGFACSRSHQVENGHVHLRTHNISTLGTLNFDLLVRIDPKMVHPQKASIRAGDILFNNTNSQELVGKTSLVDRDYDYGFSNHITRIRLKDGIFPGFVVFYLTLLRNSGYFARLCTRWINQAAVNTDTLKEQTIPLPPLAEQKRIVAKVDELMALCDRLEAQQQERETRHAALARASLARFADAPTPANLPFLFHPSYAIPPADLRKSILTLAVQGKLVPQDPNDEPAASLISQIAEEKRRLVAARIIRDKDEAAQITNDELPFEVPYGWEWTRLSSITRRIHYGYTASAKSELKDVRLLRITDIQNNFVDWPSVPGCEIAKDEVAQYQLERSDILVARTGGTVGKTYLVQEVPVVAVFASYLIRIQGGTALFDRYLKLFLESPTYWVQLEEGARGAAQPNVNGQTLGRMVVSVPPLAEQRRIVAKVEQLMALVDALETQLAASRATAANLLSALVAELTAA